MRFVPIKNVEQQSVLMLHRTRDLLIPVSHGQAGCYGCNAVEAQKVVKAKVIESLRDAEVGEVTFGKRQRVDTDTDVEPEAAE